MGKVVNCLECAKVYRNLEELEDLRDNDAVCMVCNAPIAVADWDRVLASYEEDEEDLDDIEEDEDVENDSEEDWGTGIDEALDTEPDPELDDDDPPDDDEEEDEEDKDEP
jgi:hypothetical protein